MRSHIHGAIAHVVNIEGRACVAAVGSLDKGSTVTSQPGSARIRRVGPHRWHRSPSDSAEPSRAASILASSPDTGGNPALRTYRKAFVDKAACYEVVERLDDGAPQHAEVHSISTMLPFDPPTERRHATSLIQFEAASESLTIGLSGGHR